MTYILEFLDSGLIKQDVVVNSIHIESYNQITFRHACELLIVLKVFMQLYDEAREAWESGLFQYYQSVWNWIDTLRIGFFISCIMCYVQMLTDPISRDLELPLPPDQIFVDFSNLSTLTRTYVRRCAVTILMCLMSVLKYMRHSQTYGTLAITLTYAGAEIARFLLMFSLVNLTFVVMGMLMFGSTLEDFHTVAASIQTLMMMMTGEYGYQNLQIVDEVSALTFYSFYVILVFFILVNMCECRLHRCGSSMRSCHSRSLAARAFGCAFTALNAYVCRCGNSLGHCVRWLCHAARVALRASAVPVSLLVSSRRVAGAST